MPLVRDGDVRRGPGRGAGLKPAGSITALLRPALEAAVAVAREGERATPAVPAPAPLRRYLSFARLPDPALEVARRVLDDDEEFRRRVAELADESVVGRAGWLFLARPEGWEEELEELRKEAALLQAAEREDRAEREARRRLAGAEAAAARAEAAAVAANAEAERLRGELERERAERERLAAEVAALQEQLATAREERAGAIRQLKEVEARLVDRNAELRALRHELRMAQAELAQVDLAEGRAPAAPAPPEPPEPPRAGAELPGPAGSLPAAGEPAGGGAAGPSGEPEPAAEPPVDRAALAALVAEAAGAAERLSAALGAVAGLVGQGADRGSEERRGRPGGGTGGGEPAAPPALPAGRDDRTDRERRPARPVRRRPIALPPGVLDDSLTAAEHLVRAPGALLLVDGYNISHAQWHGMSPADQRARLLDACAELHARSGADIEVVFDGDGDEPTTGTLVRADVRYRFTPAGVEADDVLLERVDAEPPTRPVIVASSDRRVREGARRRGANVLGARQLLGLLRR